ncbi:MAG: hypothetical protein AB7F50_04060 [Fimbriimonadaceae bacterium]
MDRVLAREYGYRVTVRVPDVNRRESDRGYKKGWEARIPVDGVEMLDSLVQRLSKHGVETGRPYAKARQIIVPVYGKARVEKLLRLLGVDAEF